MPDMKALLWLAITSQERITTPYLLIFQFRGGTTLAVKLDLHCFHIAILHCLQCLHCFHSLHWSFCFHCLHSGMYAYIYCYMVRALQKYRTLWASGAFCCSIVCEGMGLLKTITTTTTQHCNQCKCIEFRPFSGSGCGPTPVKVKIDQNSYEPNPGGFCVRSWGIYYC